jgi:drug/metabolite transporter (DMT)-like permease
MWIGLAGVFCCALAYGVGTVLQSAGSRRAPPGDSVDARALTRLVRSAPFLAGMTLDGVGFAASVLALRSMPLFLVESGIASSVGVTALVSSRWLHTTLSRRQVRALWALGLGLILLAAAAAPEAGAALPPIGQWAVLASALPIATLFAVPRRWPHLGVPALAAGAGLGFGGVGIAARALTLDGPWWHLAAQPLLWALPVHGVLATYCYAAALQRGSATVVSAVTFAVETVIPAGIGLAFLGDAARPGFGAVAAAGFVLTVGAAVAVSRA